MTDRMNATHAAGAHGFLASWPSLLGAALAWPVHLAGGWRGTASLRRDIRDLEALDDAVLRDIGVKRRDIRRIVAERHASSGGARVAGIDWWRNL
ncbi:hypothetical protein [Zavarzinia sp. CC-PAN008]|uniref:hypothetical protein n=1 Tax=Zavarzinia sp. CC-PAN008 TaxID=3243332 RepID=UPI003F74800A